MPTEKLGLPLIASNHTADIVRDFNALAEEIDDKVAPAQDLVQLAEEVATHKQEKASTTEFGHVMVGSGLSVNDGVISADIPENPALASKTVFGVVKVGTGIDVNEGVISLGLQTADIYRYGNEFTQLTGGFVDGYNLGNGIRTKETENLYFQLFGSTSESQATAYVTDSLIDLSAFSKLKIRWEQYESSACRAVFSVATPTSKLTTLTSNSANITNTGDFTEKTDVLDVSSLNGQYHIKLGLNEAASTFSRPGKLKVYEIWGEK